MLKYKRFRQKQLQIPPDFNERVPRVVITRLCDKQKGYATQLEEQTRIFFLNGHTPVHFSLFVDWTEIRKWCSIS